MTLDFFLGGQEFVVMSDKHVCVCFTHHIIIVPVCQVECLLHAITMVNVNVNIQDTGMDAQQLENGKHKIINVTKP